MKFSLLASSILAVCFATSAWSAPSQPEQSFEKRQNASANVFPEPDGTSKLGVQTWKAPSWHFPATGPWSHVSKYGGLLYVAGQRGYDADTDKLVETNVAPGVNNTLPGYTRIKKAYEDMLSIAAAAGATPQDCVRTVIYTTDMFRFRATANAVTIELWGNGTDAVYPVRTIIEVSRLNEDDIIEVEGTFAVPQ